MGFEAMKLADFSKFCEGQWAMGNGQWAMGRGEKFFALPFSPPHRGGLQF